MKHEEKGLDKLAALQLPFLGMPIAPPGGIMTDPFGSYTGRSIYEDPIPEEDVLPVQDADDL